MIIEKVFAEDHRVITRGFRDILHALEAGDIERAIEQADDLDRAAGGHIAFEEQVLYPEVAHRYGPAYARRLYQEHAIALDALRRLASDDALDEESIKEVMAGIRVGLEHAVSCGTLSSVLSDLSEDRQESMLRTLDHLRRESPRWTTLTRGR